MLSLRNLFRRKPAPTRLNLGAGDQPKDGFWNVDIHQYGDIDQIVDLRKRWPWKDGSIEWISASEVAEHLPDPIHFMNEAWRVLKPGGYLDMVVPSSDSRAAFQDPTHRSFWNHNSFYYYSVDYPDYNQRYPEIKCSFKIKIGESKLDENHEIHTRALCEKVPCPTRSGSKRTSPRALLASLPDQKTSDLDSTTAGEPLKLSVISATDCG